MLPFMLFIFLCFFGILSVLLYVLRRQNQIYRALHDDHAQLHSLLRTPVISTQHNGASPSSHTATPRHADAQPPTVNQNLAHLDFKPDKDDSGLALHFDTIEGMTKRT
ncbi:MAG: hypothetical protein LBV65_00040 [Desulfovibrio sp.]|nr:hypothetical protein [Desulfovibrio sp.]